MNIGLALLLLAPLAACGGHQQQQQQLEGEENPSTLRGVSA